MKKVLSIVGAFVLIGIGVFLYQQYFKGNVQEYPNRPTVVKDSKRIRTFVDESDGGFDIYYLIRRDDGTDLRVDNVYYWDTAAPDYASENFIRFSDAKQNLVGLYNDKGEVVIPAIYSALSKVHNGMLYALEGGVRDNIGQNGDRHDILLGGTTLLLNTKGEVLIENMDIPSLSLDMFSLKLTDEPIIDSYYKSFKGVNGQYYNFVQLEEYFKHFIMSEFLPSTLDDNWEKYLSNTIVTNVEIDNGNIGDYNVYNKQEMLSSQKDIIMKAFKLARTHDPKFCELDYSVDDWIVTVDTEIIEKDKSIYLNKEGVWKGEEFPVFELNIKEVKGGQTRSNHFDFYRNKDGGMTLYQITIRSNYY